MAPSEGDVISVLGIHIQQDLLFVYNWHKLVKAQHFVFRLYIDSFDPLLCWEGVS